MQAATPKQTTATLEQRLLRRYWVEINRLLEPFGKHICVVRRPHRSDCLVYTRVRQARIQMTGLGF